MNIRVHAYLRRYHIILNLGTQDIFLNEKNKLATTKQRYKQLSFAGLLLQPTAKSLELSNLNVYIVLVSEKSQQIQHVSKQKPSIEP